MLIKTNIKEKIMGREIQYGIYTIKDEKEIPSALLEDERTLYIKLNGKDIKDYYVDFMDIMQNAFNFHTKDCINNPMAYMDWMCDLGWIRDKKEGLGLSKIILIIEYWNEVGNGCFSSGEKVREMILKDFMGFEKDGYEYPGILQEHYERAKEFLEEGEDESEFFETFNIYLVG